MWYEIIVSKDGVYYFSTARRALDMVPMQRVRLVYLDLLDKFPLDEGYNVFVKRHEESSKQIRVGVV